jgi:TolA-binding protein
MKKILISLIAASALAGAAKPAAAQPINQRQADVERRIDMGLRNHSLSHREASRLRAEAQQIQRLEYRYRRDGLSRWERADLDRRLDVLSRQIRIDRHDRDYGQGYGDRHDDGYRGDGYRGDGYRR